MWCTYLKVVREKEYWLSPIVCNDARTLLLNRNRSNKEKENEKEKVKEQNPRARKREV